MDSTLQDDIGHMFRAMALLMQDGGCLSAEAQPPASLLSATKRMRSLFAAWSAEVEKDGWKIASLNQSLHRWQPTGGGGAFEFTMTANTVAAQSIASAGHDLNPGPVLLRFAQRLAFLVVSDTVGAAPDTL